MRNARSSSHLPAVRVGAIIALALAGQAAFADAFPGAKGFGRHAEGWRGGDVVKVDSLADEGPGSLRACAEAVAGPRVCVFEVGGDIVLDEPIRVASNTYIAGQTAPGQGVQLRLGASTMSPIVLDGVHDVLIRFLKLRPGPPPIPVATVSGITVARSSDVYLDRLSIAFATDQNVSVHAGPEPAHDITIARSIIAWGLDRANHPDGAHSKGALICSREPEGGECGRVSLISNLFANNRDRNPEAKATALGPIEILGNVIYNPKSEFAEIYNDTGDTRVNFAGNLGIAGRSTRRQSRPAVLRAERRRDDARLEVFTSGNASIVGRGCDGAEPPLVQAIPETVLTPRPVGRGAVEPPPTLGYPEMLAEVGAQAPAGPALDALDARLLAEIERCEGRIVDSPEQAGGWPVLPEVSGPPDGDGDGMPDAWEAACAGLDANDPADAWTDVNGDGWSNLESYLAFLAGDPTESCADEAAK